MFAKRQFVVTRATTSCRVPVLARHLYDTPDPLAPLEADVAPEKAVEYRITIRLNECKVAERETAPSHGVGAEELIVS
jgi:hypothetical protein